MSEVKEHIRDVSGRSDSPESYGGDSIERGAEYTAIKTKDAAKDVGDRVRHRIENKVRDKLKDRLEKEDAQESNHTERDSNRADGGSSRADREPDRSPREVEREPEARSARVKTNETADTPEQPKRTVRERPGTDGEKHIKTKDEYIRSQGEGFEKPKEVRQSTSSRQNTAARKESVRIERTSAPKKQPEVSGKPKTIRGNRASRPVTEGVQKAAKGSVKTAEKGAVKTVQKGTVKTAQTAGKATVKTAKAGVKTAERTARTAVKTAKTTVRATQKAAQAAARAARAASRAAVKAAQLAAKAIATAVKAIAAAIKGIVAAIAAGGWVAVVIILAIALVAVILCACFGVFASNETEDGSKPMTEAIQTIDTEFKAGIDARIAELSAGDYESVTVKYAGDMDGDSDYIVSWNDVIAVYSVRVTMDDTAPTDVVQITPEKIEVLKQTFYDMNSVSYETEVITTEETVENEEGEEETVTHQSLIIHVTVNSMEYTQAADLYAFDDYKRQALDAMMEPQMILMYAELIGVDIYDGVDLTKIISGLPVGTMGSDVLQVALTKVGSPYVLGAKGPTRFDCSGLVYWSINEIDPELGRKLYTSAGYQYKYCKENGYLVGESEVQPGDLIFWYKPNCSCGAKYAEVHHTGFYLGDGQILDASSSNGRVIIRKLFDGSSYKVLAYARPYSY